MLKTLLIKFVLIVFAICLLIFIELKLEVIDYLRFVNSVKSLEGRSIAYSSNGEIIAVGKKFTDSKTSENKKSRKEFQIEIRRVSDNSLIRSLDSLTTGNLTFSPDNSMIAAGSYDGQVYVWRISDGELLHSFNHKINVNSSRMRFLSFTQDEQNIVTFILGSSSKVSVWNLVNETNRVLSVESGNFISAALSPDGKILALGNRNKTIDFYQLDDLTLVKQLEVNRKPYSSLKFSPDGKQIAFVGNSPPTPPENRYGKNIYLHSVEDGSLLNIFYPSTILSKNIDSPGNIAISPDGRYLAVSYTRSIPSSFFVGAPRASKDGIYGRIRMWRIEDGKQLPTLRGHKRRTNSMVFSPDSKFLVSIGGDGNVRFWKMPPRNYSWLWLFCTGGLAVLLYWRRTELISLINRY